MTFTEKFDYLKKKYASKADITKLTDSFIAAQITMSDDDCKGTFYAAFIDGQLNFEPYDYHDNTVAVIVNSLLLDDFIKGKADPVKAYFDGSLQAWGNLDHALQLIECLKGKKKAPSKKKAAAPSETGTEEKPKKRTCTRKPKDTAEAEKPKKATKKTAKKDAE